MRKIICIQYVYMLVAIIFSGCGPSTEEIAAHEKVIQDSIRIADSITAAVKVKEQMVDSRGIEWQILSGGKYDGSISCIKQTAEGGYIVAGSTDSNRGGLSGNHGRTDCWIAKLSHNGEIEWQKCFGGSESDAAKSIQQTTEGGYIIAAYTSSNDGDVTGRHNPKTNFWDCWIIKLSNTGDMEWEKCLGGSYEDFPVSIQQTNDGGYIVGGNTKSYDGDVSGNYVLTDAMGNYIPRKNCWIVKLTDIGNIEWQKCIGGSNNEEVASIRQTVDGGYIVAATSNSNDGSVIGSHAIQGTFFDDVWIVKLDSLGNISWQKCLGGRGGSDCAGSIQETSDGGYILAGNTDSNDSDVSGNHGSYDCWIVKLSNIGEIQWQKCIGGSNFDRAWTIEESMDKGYIVVGLTYSNDGDVLGHDDSPNSNKWIFKLSIAGEIEWQKCFSEDFSGEQFIYQSADGKYVVAGNELTVNLMTNK